jgi:hypothetical protein
VVLEGCGSGPEHRVDLTIRNNSEKTIRLRAGSMGLSRSIELGPGESWVGWWDRRFLGNSASFEVEEVKDAKMR